MKRLGSSGSLAGVISICATTDDNSPRSNHVYTPEFRSVFDGLDEEMEDAGHAPEKKRRLSVHQVKALEKNFEVENKLEPERKVKLAQELGLQPRQVAIWFQNRRARWKTKQLERDYGVLKASYDSLKHNFETLQRDNEALVNEIRELKAKLGEDDRESNVSARAEGVIVESDNKTAKQTKTPLLSPLLPSQTPKESNYESFNNGGNGSSDSDSSAILNEDISPNLQNNASLVMSPTSSSLNCFEFHNFYQQQQVVKMEEHNFFSADEACSFFSDEQVPSLQWYCSEQWKEREIGI